MKNLFRNLLLLTALGAGLTASAQDRFAKTEIKVSHVAGSVYLLAGAGDGGVLVFTKADVDVPHLGDDLFSGRFPHFDVGRGGDPKGYHACVIGLLKTVGQSDTRIIRGHAPLSGREDLDTFAQVIDAATRFVEGGIQSGNSQVQIKSDKSGTGIKTGPRPSSAKAAKWTSSTAP